MDGMFGIGELGYITVLNGGSPRISDWWHLDVLHIDQEAWISGSSMLCC